MIAHGFARGIDSFPETGKINSEIEEAPYVRVDVAGPVAAGLDPHA